MNRYLIGLLLLAGCAPDIPQNQPTKIVVANFDPLGSPPVIPLPNDLVRDPETGLLAIPDFPGDSPATQEFNGYLRTLDGFPNSTAVTGTFSDAIDPASATISTGARPGAIAVFDASARVVLGPADYSPKVASDGKTLTIVPTKPWALAHQYVVMVFGAGDDAGLKSASGDPVVAAPFTFFLRSSRPLLSLCNDDFRAAECACPFDAKTHAYSSACHPALGLTFPQAAQLEVQRTLADKTIAAFLPESGPAKSRDNLVLLWSFSIATGPFAVFDPTQGKVPFPNDILMDQATHTVNLPIDPNLSDAQKAIYMGLNKLDGFSTTADATVPVETVDGMSPLGIAPGVTAQLINTTNLSKQPDFDALPEMVNGGQDYDGLLVIRPNRPLVGDRSVYIALVTDQITDSAGRPLRPSPVMQLIKSHSPLYDATAKKSLVPSALDDASAGQLEVLRSTFESAGLWDQLNLLLQIGRDEIAMVWVFSTQAEAVPLQALAKYPSDKSLPTDVTILDSQPGTALGADVGQIISGTMHTHLALSAGGTLDLAGGRDVDIPFTMTTPKTPPVAGAPVAIVQHGLFDWRGDMVTAMAETFAAKGWAAIGIDINYHGARSVCTDSKQCAANGTCTAGVCSTSLAVACDSDSQCAAGGTCDKTTGACSTGLAANSSLCLTHKDATGQTVTECDPAASGAAFLDFSNVFAARDNFRQHVLDLSQLQRVISATGANDLKGKVNIDPTRNAYIGQSLGGIEGSLFLAASSSPPVGVLNVPGGRLVDVLLTSQLFSAQIGPLLAANGVMPDTKGYYQLTNTFRWILDPGDPINFGRNIVTSPFPGNMAKKVIVQEAGADMTIPNPWTEALATEIGLPQVGGHVGVSAILQPGGTSPMPISTYFAGAPHGFITTPGDPSQANGLAQAITWIDSDGTKITAP